MLSLSLNLANLLLSEYKNMVNKILNIINKLKKLTISLPN